MQQRKFFGDFCDETREFVITDPATPWPWINYLGTGDFHSLISGTAGCYSFFKDAKFRRLTRYRYNSVPMDDGGRYFYIKDGDTIWNPGWKPCRTTLDSYECRHGLGYSRITGEKNGLKASVLFFVPLGYDCEIQKLTLTNTSLHTKKIHLFSFIEWCLWNAATDMENFQRNLSTGEVEVEDSVIYHKTEYRERRNHYAFYGVNAPISGFDTDRESFLGAYNGFDHPQAVIDGHCSDSIAHGWSPVASHCLEISLEAGESRDLVFVLGYAENPQEEKFSSCDEGGIVHKKFFNSGSGIINKAPAYRILRAFDSAEKVDAAFAELNAFWDKALSGFTLSSSEPRLDRMVNIWNQYQCMITYYMSRSASFFESGIGRGMGFRDSNQDLMGMVHIVPELSRERIIDIASTQFPDGGCYHQYQPLTKRGNDGIGGGFEDDPLWLILGTCAYIKETGDFSILSEMVPFDNVEGSEKSLLEHLSISFNHTIHNLGPHGLPLIGRADWNDCLNLNCFSWDPDESFQTTENKTEGSKAESLMIAGLFVVSGGQYAELLGAMPKEDKAASELDVEREKLMVETATRRMCEAVTRDGWDGDWFLRAYDYYGRKVGSHESEEAKIFIESQGWCAMALIGADKGLCDKALDSVKKYLDSEHGIVLNNPAFTHYHVEYGEISSYPQGYKENAGIFCHNNPWIIIAEALAGRKEDAWEHYRKISPAYIADQQLHKVEPYVYCQMVAGKDAAQPGEGKNSWLTGTAAWNWVAVSKYLLGIYPQYDGLMVKPCLPADFSDYKVHRVFRGAVYDIHVHNSGSGKSAFLPYTPGHHNVELFL